MKEALLRLIEVSFLGKFILSLFLITCLFITLPLFITFVFLSHFVLLLLHDNFPRDK